MLSQHYFYSASLDNFLNSSPENILGTIHINNPLSSTVLQQNNTWKEQIDILQEQFKDFTNGIILFEYIIPRMGKRVDVVLLYFNIIFIIEFKCGAKEYLQSYKYQVEDYALDLKYFHKESHDKLLVPLLVATDADDVENKLKVEDKMSATLLCNKRNLSSIITEFINTYKEPSFDYSKWVYSAYLPTPTIIEAAQALYNNHSVEDITRNDAGVENLTKTTGELNNIIEYSKVNSRKSICFVTGVPGAGKTLAGLNIAYNIQKKIRIKQFFYQVIIR